MRKVVFLLVVGVVLFGISAQSANAQNANIAQKIIGTWVDNEGSTYVFNTNGTVKIDNTELKYSVTDTKMVIIIKSGMNEGLNVFDISISSDGKTFVMEGKPYLSANARSGQYQIQRDNYWLTKK
jgi:hypothetical protein